MKPVNVWSEFQPLKKVVLGAPFPPETFDWNEDEETRRVMRQIFEETAEDIAVLEGILKDRGIEVVRPKNILQSLVKNQFNYHGCIVAFRTIR